MTPFFIWGVGKPNDEYILEYATKDLELSRESAVVLFIAAIFGAVFAISIAQPQPQETGPLDGNAKVQYTPDITSLSVFGEEPSNMTSKPNMSVHSNEEQSNTTTGSILQADNQTPKTTSQQQSASLTEEPDLSPASFLLFKNSSFGAQIRYPLNWQIIEGDRNRYDGATGIVRFISPPEDSSDEFKESLRLSLDLPPAENMTLAEYSRELIDFKNKTLDNFNLTDRNDDSNVLAGNLAYRLVYTRTIDNGIIIKEMEIGTKIDDKIYYLVYSAEQDRFRDLLPTIHYMIDSLEIG